MTAMMPVAVYGLKVPAGGDLIPAESDFPGTFRITMAAIDPNAEAQAAEGINAAQPRATLTLVRMQPDDEDDEDDEDEFDEELMRRLAGEDVDDDEESSSDEEVKGGPSDPAKTKKARKEAAAKQLKELLANEEDVDMDLPNGVNGTKKSAKGKAKAIDVEESDEDEDEDDDEEGEEVEAQEFVLCTLDPSKNYQQPIDITIGEDEEVYFKVNGTHTVYLTGNYLIPAGGDQDHGDDGDDYDSEEDGYDLPPDEDELDSEDELDELEDPRVTQVESEEEEAPKLVKAAKKGKNKRAAEESEDEEAGGLDALISKSIKPEAATNGEAKLSKKQLKKLKNNAGEAVAAENKTGKKDEISPAKSDKKVQFAKNLEQGPTPSPKVDAKTDTAKTDKPKGSLGVKTVQGVKIDDKKLGTGPAAKKGDRVGMRYIGKLEKDGKVFDSNKKGKPFTFKLGSGEVIKGWDIGIAGMSVGGERRITIPAALGYGSKGAPPSIPGNANLVFDIKCIEIK
ncbi:hypothetical protein BJ546DRAFT_238735 [Cryomyces antarcticus]